MENKSNLAAFSDVVAQYATQCILTPLSEDMRINRSINYSVEDMMRTLNMQAKVPVPSAMNSMSPVGIPFSSIPVKGTAAAPKPKTAVPEGAGCTYVFKKGQKKDQVCGVRTVPGLPVCNAHNKGGAAPGTPGAPAKATTQPGFYPGLPATGYKTATPPPSNVSSSEGISVVLYNEAEGLYKDTVNNFIVKVVNAENDFVAVGRFNPVTNRVDALTKADEQLATSLMIELPSQQQVAPSPTPIFAQVAPSSAPVKANWSAPIPGISGMPTGVGMIPGMPIGSASIPGMPMGSPIPGMNMAQIVVPMSNPSPVGAPIANPSPITPNLGGAPSIPSIPGISSINMPSMPMTTVPVQ